MLLVIPRHRILGYPHVVPQVSQPAAPASLICLLCWAGAGIACCTTRQAADEQQGLCAAAQGCAGGGQPHEQWHCQVSESVLAKDERVCWGEMIT